MKPCKSHSDRIDRYGDRAQLLQASKLDSLKINNYVPCGRIVNVNFKLVVRIKTSIAGCSRAKLCYFLGFKLRPCYSGLYWQTTDSIYVGHAYFLGGGSQYIPINSLLRKLYLKIKYSSTVFGYVFAHIRALQCLAWIILWNLKIVS